MIDDTAGRVLPLLQCESDELDSRSFSEEEVQMYVKAITDVLADREQYQKMCRNCRRKIEEGFYSQIMIRKLERIFEDLVQNSVQQEKRQETAKNIGFYSRILNELPTLMNEVSAYEAMYKNAYAPDTKNELMRIANSKWGRRVIKLAFKLRLNKLF